MGMGAEMYEDLLLQQLAEESWMESRTTWKTRDGRVIPIKEMTTDHIRNTINYLNNNDKVIPTLMLEVLKVREIMGE